MTNTKAVGAAVIGGQEYMLYVVTTDGTAIEITYRDLAGALKDLKDSLKGKTMTSFWIFLPTPSDLDLVQFKEDGGILFEWKGCINAALGHNPQLVVPICNCFITGKTAFEITTSD